MRTGIIRGVRMREYYNKWQRIRYRRQDLLLNEKRNTASVSEGALQTELTSQRLQPAPRRKKRTDGLCGS